MNLIIDVGNTLLKLAVFEADELQHKKTCIKSDFLEILDTITENNKEIKNCIVSSVGAFTKHQLSQLEEKYPVSVLTHETKVPFKNLYATPSTLGVDRIALVSAAAAQYSGKNVLIIDAGSCITFDFLSSESDYLGGAISPGVTMRYSALHKNTAKLPLLDPILPKSLIGNTTNTSIHSGVVNGVLNEIDGTIAAYRNNYEDLTVILTGGDAHFLRDSLKSDIFANSNFLLEGLNYILEHNKY
ncbi:type III pantothenate kinase [Ulvibacter antarcticus]|uniref:Type III pantothenate kinase n=1 Tax=Ulvibacter antarcticus TaxID=442714 RepID=A0A3L9Z1R8_9FLAO|nr:type III pantothenate kinase [Ulvibacter antarcticus]RMA66474.1 type III pantothenate kinase [Ulvibacter antarcticus]